MQTGDSASLPNPIITDSITEFLLSILSIVLVLAIPLVVFFLIYAGFKYVMALGNPEKLKEATGSIMWGVVGAVIILASFVIVEIVKNVVDSFGVTPA